MVRSEEINMENQEDILDALSTYEKKPTPEIPPLLESFLRQVAKTGETLFPWQRLKSLMINKLDQVITQFHQDFPADHLQNCPNVENTKFEEMRKRILQSVEEFQGAPFTIQRICELMTEPKKHYKRSDKFLRGIEKNVLVVSTVDPFGRKIVSESRNLVNGLDMNGYSNEQLDQRPLQFTTFPSPHQAPAAECVRLNEFLDSNANNASTNGTLETNHESRSTVNKNEVSECSVSNQSEVKVSSHCEGEVVTQSEVKVGEEEELKCDGNAPKSADSLSTSEQHKTEGDISSSDSTLLHQEETREPIPAGVEGSKAEDIANEKDTVKKEDRLGQVEGTAPAEELLGQSQSVTGGDQGRETQKSITDPSAVSSSSELASNLDPEPSDTQQSSEPVHSSTENQETSSSSSEASSVEEASSSVQNSEPTNTSSMPESTLPNEPCEETNSSDNVFKNTDPCVGEKMEVDSTVSNVQPIDTSHQVDDNSCHNSESESTGDKMKVESESNTQSADVPMDED